MDFGNVLLTYLDPPLALTKYFTKYPYSDKIFT